MFLTLVRRGTVACVAGFLLSLTFNFLAHFNPRWISWALLPGRLLARPATNGFEGQRLVTVSNVGFFWLFFAVLVWLTLARSEDDPL